MGGSAASGNSSFTSGTPCTSEVVGAGGTLLSLNKLVDGANGSSLGSYVGRSGVPVELTGRRELAGPGLPDMPSRNRAGLAGDLDIPRLASLMAAFSICWCRILFRTLSILATFFWLLGVVLLPT